MNFKIDENLPTEYTTILRRAGLEADTVADEDLSGTDDAIVFVRCQTESRIFMTLDLDFANVQAYPPESHFGVIVFRSKSQDKTMLIALLERLLPTLSQRSPCISFGSLNQIESASANEMPFCVCVGFR